MFKIKQTSTFYWPVEINVVQDCQHEKQGFDAEFRRVGQAEMEGLFKRVEAGEMTEADFVRSVMPGWRGVVDDGNEVLFSVGALDRLLDIPGMAASIMLSFGRAHAGIVRKN